jgi:hypothetical protein
VRLILLLFLALLAQPAACGAVGLVTVPERQGVRLTIYNGVDLTLVQESRLLVLRRGLNRIQYQWAGTLIDTTSLELRPLEHQDDLEIIDTVSPPHAPATLVWEIESKVEGPVRFEISYFTSGVGWTADYVLRAAPDESSAEVEGWVAVDNRSGEDYPRAEVRLVVGTITLVEQIRDLATGQLSERSRKVERQELLHKGRGVLRQALSDKDGAGAASALAGDNKEMIVDQVVVVSARLADYHLFSIGGQQAVRNQATTRFLALAAAKPMPLEVLYRVVLGDEQATKLYRFTNDAEHQLPDGPLPEGPWQVFRVTDPATRELSYTALAPHSYVPPGQKVELELGADPALAVTQIHEQHAETDQHYDKKGRIDGWIAHERWRFAVVDSAPIPVSLEFMVAAQGDWSISGLGGERRDQTSWRHQDRIPAGARLELGPFTISTRMGERVQGGAAAQPARAPAGVALPPIRTAP